MKSNHPINPLVWFQIALFMGAVVLLLLGALYMTIVVLILPLF